MARIEDLYTKGPAAGSKAPILIAHFEGAMDAGSAGTLAVVQLLTSLSPERVATFDTDLLIDYRSHRPVMEVDEWVTTDMSEPEIALDLVHDDAGTPILLLHGPEPDARWKSFRDAVGTLAEEKPALKQSFRSTDCQPQFPIPAPPQSTCRARIAT